MEKYVEARRRWREWGERLKEKCRTKRAIGYREIYNGKYRKYEREKARKRKKGRGGKVTTKYDLSLED